MLCIDMAWRYSGLGPIMETLPDSDVVARILCHDLIRLECSGPAQRL